jgi:hypothetical protein
MALVTRRGVHDRGVRWLWLLMAWSLISSFPARLLAAPTEYEVKAGFLYHFGWFVDWPAATVQGRAHTFIIGVLGASPFDDVLDAVMQSKVIRERPVVIQYYQQAKEALSCHILFISAAEEPRLPAILAVLEGASILTVSDMERFAERGGMIALRLVDRKVHFDINVAATEHADLQLSSQLLRLAKIIHNIRRVRE